MTEKEKIEVETVECVQLEGIDAKGPADPAFRVEIDGVCFDFEHRRAADQLAGILTRMREDNERLTEERDEAIARAERAEASLPEDIRNKGWAVAVHNDYRLNGEKHTFWLFTKGDFAIKGEGLTDAEALDAIRTSPAFFTLNDGARK